MEKQETMTSDAVFIDVQLVVEDVVVAVVVVLSSLSDSLSLGSPSSGSFGSEGSGKFGSGMVGK